MLSKATRINHVSVPAVDLEESESFYVDVFGMERLPAPNFGFPVCWLALGNTQLHLQQLDLDTGIGRTYQHFGIEVEDFLATFRALQARRAFDAEGETRYGSIWLLPRGELQMFFRDPAENLVEVDWPDASAIDLEALAGRVKVLDEDEPDQDPRATLFLSP